MSKGMLLRGGIFAFAVAAVMVLSAGSAAATATSHAVGTASSAGDPGATIHSLPPEKLRGMYVGPAQRLSSGTGLKSHGAGISYSSNWAGYADVAKAGDGVTQEVTAEWYTPSVSCANAPSGGDYEVQWIGIDGWATGTVEQVGTLSYCSTTDATPGYYSWWESFPYNDIQTVNSISGGAFVQAYVLYNPAACVNGDCGVYTVVFSNLDNYADNFQVTFNPSACDSSGCETGADSGPECISEAPSGFGYSGITPLADYGTTTFYACAAEIDGHFAGLGSLGGEATIYKIDQKGPTTGLVIQQTSGWTSYFYGKSEFTITWKGLD